MSTTPFRLCTAAVAASAALALALTGCSSASKTRGPAVASATSSAESAPSAAPGTSALSVDGKPVSGNFTTTCANQAGLLALAMTDTGNPAYGNLAVSATVTGGNTVQAVGITGSKGGSSGLPYAIGFGKGAPGGSASVTKSGNTFHITGEGVGTLDPGNPLAGAKSAKFDITVACPAVIGG